MTLRRLLLVCEPGKDGAFDHVARLFDYLTRRQPELVIDLAFSSLRSRASLGELVAAARRRGGETVDLRIGNAPEAGDLRACWKIAGLVRRHRPQIVHAHSSKAGALCRMLRALWPGFPPLVYTPHAYYGMGNRGTAAALLFNGVEKILGHVGVSVGASFDERTFGVAELGLPPRRVVLINNGIDVGRFHPVSPAERKKFREELSLPGGATLLITVGRDSIQKNYRPLYRAVETVLREKNGALFFVHAGAGAEALGKTLNAEVQKYFRAYEHLENVERLFGAADAFILTSRYETLCLSALQALASGLKIFLTLVPGNACLQRIGFGEISWIDAGGDESGLSASVAAALRSWLEGPVPPSPQQAAVARRHVASDIQCEKIRRLYGRLLREA